ncbi:M56 family metallopeptidase [Lipingzhangella sp. LS1_29]|uniref:M56 family metallopeptidase n=1 Tax=Lipingzhangella rawalii TaxID=2055835 RepID=A0ABU2H5G7_9ACTN|nr:M56 family metallopeptidase [Lipingzhangella rawalii]MDS1270242.1 M56 family metallopeptidase [Lipingzhangella rawalii]
MVSAALLTAISVGCLLGAVCLRRASWPIRGPHVAVVVWQALGLAWGIATIGALLAFAVAPYGLGVVGGISALYAEARSGGVSLARLDASPFGAAELGALLAALALTALLCSALAVSLFQVLRTRRRHRELLRLVARDDPEVPGARVLDHPGTAAYCLPGITGAQVVISTGAVAVLQRRELSAVLAHEHAHLRQRHDLVLLPFSSLKRAFPKVPFVESCYSAVALLIEICADDHARRTHCARELATALLRFGSSGKGTVPPGALAAQADSSEPEVVTRVSRLLDPTLELSRTATAGALLFATTLMTTTMALWKIPF